MTVAGPTRGRAFIEDLARSEPGRLLQEELARRWPESADQLCSMLRYALLPAGKLLRPIMMLHAAEAVGGSAADVLPAALGMEYLHVATLVHDDIIDADPLRRGRPTVPVAYGVPGAILAGDHLIFSAFGALADGTARVQPGQVIAAIAALADAGRDLCCGQMVETQLVGDLDAGARRYPEVIRLKTGALFRVVCQIGALLGGADTSTASRLGRYGEQVGMAFQIRDDLLDYRALTDGADLSSDLRNGRPTLPLLLAYQAASEPQRLLLRTVLRRGGSAAGDGGLIAALLTETGAVVRAWQQAAGHATRAQDELAMLGSSPSLDVLTGIARWATIEGE
jgi:geranylgeranyl diphosphate synthase, type I